MGYAGVVERRPLMKLKTRVWHGYYREKGETVTPCPAPQGWVDHNTTDDHGCGNFWVTDPNGELMNVWECEVEL
jgi:hypothetical protein